MVVVVNVVGSVTVKSEKKKKKSTLSCRKTKGKKSNELFIIEYSRC